MAAERLFAQKAFDPITIEEIAEAAELAKGTFYRYFEDKDAIAKEVALNARRALAVEVETAQSGVGDPALRLALGMCVFLRCAALNPSRAAIIARMAAQWLHPESAGNEQLGKDLEAGYRTKRFTNATRQAANVMTVGLVQAGIWQLLGTKDGIAVKELATSLCSMALRALGVSSSQARSVAATAVSSTFDKNLDSRQPTLTSNAFLHDFKP